MKPRIGDAKQKNRKSDDGERRKNGCDILYFKNWQKMRKAVEKSLPRAMEFFAIILAICVHHVNHSAFCDRIEEAIKHKNNNHAHNKWDKIRLIR